MNRRIFMALAGVTGLALAIPLIRKCSKGNSNEIISTPSTLNMLLDEESIKSIGHQYLIQNPEENSTEILYRTLQEKEDFSKMNDEERNINILKKIKDDFESDRFVIIEGLIISVTEARQCAMYFLIS